jgi:hypothetical protein
MHANAQLRLLAKNAVPHIVAGPYQAARWQQEHDLIYSLLSHSKLYAQVNIRESSRRLEIHFQKEPVLNLTGWAGIAQSV